MSGFYGADTEQLRSHSELLRNRAQAVSELRDRLQPSVMDESIWRGSDADGFRSTWASQTTALFDQVQEALTQRGGDLETHAEEQDTASGVGGEGDSTSQGEGGGGEKSLWQKITDGLGVYNKLQGLWSKGKKIWDLANIVRDHAKFLNNAEDIFQLAAGTWSYGQEITKNIFSKGDEFSSLAAKIAGQLGIPTGIGNTKFFGWVDDAAKWVGESAPFLTDLAPKLGKALPALDVIFGGKQMIEGINSGDTFSAVTGGASALGGTLMLAGGAMSATGVGAVIGGPLAAAGAVISGGAALADVGKMVYDNWDSISSTASDAWDGAKDVAGDVGSAIADGASNAWDGLSNAFSW